MAFADLQRTSQKTGDIRLGAKVPDSSKNGYHPTSLDTFRFTSGSRYAIEAAAREFGGEVLPWMNDYGRQIGWQVITGVSELDVQIPPHDAVIDQWYRMYSRGGQQRKCDGVREILSGGECLCPHATDLTNADEVRAKSIERDELAKRGQACSRYTQIYVRLPSLPDIGVWRVTTGGFYAAREVQDKIDALLIARSQDVYLAAALRIEPRDRMENGKLKKFGVLVIELRDSMVALVGGQLEAGAVAGLRRLAAVQERLAIAAGSGTPPVPALEAPAAGQPPRQRAQRPAPKPAGQNSDDPDEAAQEIADEIRVAATADHVKILGLRAKRLELADRAVRTSAPGERELHEQLREFGLARFAELSRAESKAAG
jgi:hypothetical protein